jgi:hypothetical protein
MIESNREIDELHDNTRIVKTNRYWELVESNTDIDELNDNTRIVKTNRHWEW